jgi:hypothetical protein
VNLQEIEERLSKYFDALSIVETQQIKGKLRVEQPFYTIKRKYVRTSNLKYNDNITPSFTCPVNARETILANCDCEENIDALTNHTISVLEAVDQMTKDWICSSN